MAKRELQVGDKIRMLESGECYPPAGTEGVVAYQDHDGDFWADFGDAPQINPPVENWWDLNDDTWCVGSGVKDTLPKLEVIS